jgi:hypothetical protein
MKTVLQLDVRGSEAPLDAILSTLPDQSEPSVWDEEFDLMKGEDEDGTPMLAAHIPYHDEGDARDKFAEVTGLSTLESTAQPGSQVHVHECPTSGSSEAWDCGDRILDELLV